MNRLKGIICVIMVLFFANIAIGENNKNQITAPKDAITVKGNLNLGITVYLQKIQNDAEVIMHSSCNEWIMLPNGEIVLKNNPKFGLTVNQQSLKNNSLVILHQGYNQWSTNMKNPKPVPEKATGQNTVYAEYANKGEVIGHFKEIDENTWGEFKKGRGDVHATFTLKNRDAWSIYLYDGSRGMNLTLNLHTKQILVGNNKIYDITKFAAMEWFPYSPPENTSTVSYDFTLQTMNYTKYPKRVENIDYSKAYYVSYAPNKNITIVNALERSTVEWYFENLGNGYYNLRNRTNNYLSVHNSGTADGTNLKMNAKLNRDNQSFRFEQNVQGNIRIISKLGDNLYVGHANVSNGIGNLVLRNGDKGYNTIFRLIPRKTISQKATGSLELFAQQYAAPVSNKPVTQAELNGMQTIVYSDGILQQVSGQNDWVRLDADNKVVDVLKEVSRKNGEIFLETYNSFVYDFPLNSAASHEAYYDINIDLQTKRVKKFHPSGTEGAIISATSNKYYALGNNAKGEACTEFRVVIFRGMVTMAYASTNAFGKSDKVCSGGLEREKNMFKPACLNHDKNWAAPWRLAGYNNKAGQPISDAIFLIDLKAIVDDSNNPIDHTAVGFFYRSVRASKQGLEAYHQGRSVEGDYHRVIFTAEQKTKDILTNIVTEEYAKDLVDDIFRAGEGVKDFFWYEYGDWFRGM